MAHLQRILLGLVGLLIIMTGIDNAFGGIATLGWQLSPGSFAVTRAADFAVRDSHVHFIGGVWLGCGMILLAAALSLKVPRATIAAVFGLIVVGGLARFTQGDLPLLLSANILPSLLAELLLFPLLALWVWRTRALPR